jgi:hypothetical protein
MRELSFIHDDGDFEIALEIDDDDNILSVEIIPGIYSMAPAQKVNYRSRVPLVPTLFRVDAIINPRFMKSCIGSKR